jgi:hypothetical protein
MKQKRFVPQFGSLPRSFNVERRIGGRASQEGCKRPTTLAPHSKSALHLSSQILANSQQLVFVDAFATQQQFLHTSAKSIDSVHG